MLERARANQLPVLDVFVYVSEIGKISRQVSFEIFHKRILFFPNYTRTKGETRRFQGIEGNEYIFQMVVNNMSHRTYIVGY